MIGFESDGMTLTLSLIESKATGEDSLGQAIPCSSMGFHITWRHDLNQKQNGSDHFMTTRSSC